MVRFYLDLGASLAIISKNHCLDINSPHYVWIVDLEVILVHIRDCIRASRISFMDFIGDK